MRYLLLSLLLLSPGCKDDKESSAASTTTPEQSEVAPAPEVAPEAPAPAPVAKPTVELSEVKIVPGVSLGPVEIGMTRQEVDALGILKTHPQYSAMTIPFTVYYEDDKVSGAEVSLQHAPVDIDVGETRIPRTATMQSAAALLKDCNSPDERIGGTIIPCREGKLSVSVGSGSPDEVWLRIWRPGDLE